MYNPYMLVCQRDKYEGKNNTIKDVNSATIRVIGSADERNSRRRSSSSSSQNVPGHTCVSHRPLETFIYSELKNSFT